MNIIGKIVAVGACALSLALAASVPASASVITLPITDADLTIRPGRNGSSDTLDTAFGSVVGILPDGETVVGGNFSLVNFTTTLVTESDGTLRPGEATGSFVSVGTGESSGFLVIDAPVDYSFIVEEPRGITTVKGTIAISQQAFLDGNAVEGGFAELTGLTAGSNGLTVDFMYSFLGTPLMDGVSLNSGMIFGSRTASISGFVDANGVPAPGGLFLIAFAALGMARRIPNT